MHSTMILHDPHALNINHNSDWSGDVHVRVYRLKSPVQTSFNGAKIPEDARPIVDVEVSGMLFVGLAVNMLNRKVMGYVEDIVEKATAVGGPLSKMLQR
jgi:hypothetical protein